MSCWKFAILQKLLICRQISERNLEIFGEMSPKGIYFRKLFYYQTFNPFYSEQISLNSILIGEIKDEIFTIM